MKTCFSLKPMVLLLLCAAACSGPQMRAKRTLNNYLDAAYRGRPEEAYRYVSTQDQAAKSLQDYIDESREDQLLFSALGHKVSWDIKRLDVEDGRAQAEADVKMPTLDLILRETWSMMTGEGESMRRFLAMLADRVRRGELRTTTERRSYSLVRENEEWKVDTNWAETQGQQAALKQEKEAYLNNISTQNVQVSSGSVGGASIQGEIKNAGNRALRNVELTVYFLDAKGNPIYEKAETVPSPFPVPFHTERHVLKPGYIHKFSVETKEAPATWSGRVLVKPTDVQFVGEKKSSES